jgi:hypothetical protein
VCYYRALVLEGRREGREVEMSLTALTTRFLQALFREANRIYTLPFFSKMLGAEREARANLANVAAVSKSFAIENARVSN